MRCHFLAVYPRCCKTTHLSAIRAGRGATAECTLAWEGASRAAWPLVETAGLRAACGLLVQPRAVARLCAALPRHWTGLRWAGDPHDGRERRQDLFHGAACVQYAAQGGHHLPAGVRWSWRQGACEECTSLQKARVLGGRGVGRRVRRCSGVLSDESAYGYRRRRTGRFPSGTGHLCRCNGRKRRAAIQRPVDGGRNGRRLRSAGCPAIQTPWCCVSNGGLLCKALFYQRRGRTLRDHALWAWNAGQPHYWRQDSAALWAAFRKYGVERLSVWMYWRKRAGRGGNENHDRADAVADAHRSRCMGGYCRALRLRQGDYLSGGIWDHAVPSVGKERACGVSRRGNGQRMVAGRYELG